MLDYINSISLRRVIIGIAITSLIIDITSKSTQSIIVTSNNDLLLVIANSCFYFILLKKTLANNSQETKLKTLLAIGSIMLIISRFIVAYDIHEFTQFWGIAGITSTEASTKYLQEVTQPKTIPFLIMGNGLIIYFFYRLSQNVNPVLKKSIRFLGIWSLILYIMYIYVLYSIVVYYVLSIEATTSVDTSQLLSFKSIQKWNLNIFWYISLIILYRKVKIANIDIKL